MGTHSEGVSARRGRSVFFVWLLVGFLVIGTLVANSAFADGPDDDPTPAPIADPPPSPDEDDEEEPEPSADPDPAPSAIETENGEELPSAETPAGEEVSPASEVSVLGETLSASGTDMTGLTILGVSLIVLGAASYGLAYRSAKLR